MNKKNLSVVMAGAMLATSVAPVLAAETTMPASQLDLLIKNLETKMNSEVVSSDSRLVDMGVPECQETSTTDSAGHGSVSSAGDCNKPVSHGESVYGLQLLNAKGNIVKLNNEEINYSLDETNGAIAKLKAALTGVDNLEGYTIKVFERDYETFLGQNILSTVPVEDSSSKEYYTNEDIEVISKVIGTSDVASDPDSTGYNDYAGLSNGTYLNEYIKADSAVLTTKDGKNTVTFELQALENGTNKTVTLTMGDQTLNFNRAVDSNGELIAAPGYGTPSTDLQKCNGFLTDVSYKTATTLTADPVELSSTKLTVDADDTKVSYTASELYDGFALTAAGTEIADMIKNEKNTTIFTSSKSTQTSGSGGATVNNQVLSDADIKVDSTTGITDLTITISDSKGRVLKEVKVTSANEKEMKSLYNLIKDGSYNVGIIGGNTRYETAVNVARAQGIANFANDTNAKNIVLVNGTSLVDGLSAAPLASKLDTAVLLSETDSLPTATKEYLKELTNDVAPANMKYITINLVGGEGVLSDSLVKELEEMGFSVERFGGDNREETSLAVAEEVATTADGENEVFVVGGTGEADAMSIAAYAAQEEKAIIVSSVHGLTDDAVNFIKKNASAKTSAGVTIIGGEKVVSKDEESKIDEVIETAVNRVAGSNRQETNAKVIKEFYSKVPTEDSTVEGIVMVKDGMKNSSELVDALSAANYAATMNAPIVLASSSVTDAQKNALLGIDINSDDDGYTEALPTKISQVGIGAERTVLETIADLFNISNTK